MHTITILPEEPPAETGIYIKADFKKPEIKNIAGRSNKKQKAIVRKFSQAFDLNKSTQGRSTYTIQPGDGKRLSKDGLLRVYDVDKPIDIPVKRLLGRWKSENAGIRLIVANGQWCIEGELFEPILKPESRVLVALRHVLKFTMA